MTLRCRFREKPEEYKKLIEARDEEGLMALLTNAAVEERVLQRVRNKAATFAQEIEAAGGSTAAEGPQLKVDPDVVHRLYKDFVIPLTKEAEVAYLLQRCLQPALEPLSPMPTLHSLSPFQGLSRN